MRIALSSQIPGGNGPGIFTKRLVEHLRRLPDVQIVSDKPDIFFAVIRTEDAPPGAKVVLRLDGLYWDKARQSLNTPIFQSIKRSHAIIFQSEFSKRCYQYRMPIPFNRVIHNGVDIDWVNRIEPQTLPFGPGFVSCADWRPTKRPNSICKGFAHANLPCHLYMIGNVKTTYPHEKIHWMGPKSSEEVISILKSCSHAIHLAKFDACSNTVIEELVCGLPVLHSANGGTPELVQGNGICFPVDKNWDYSVQKSSDADNISPETLAPYIKQLYSMPKIGPRNDLSISTVAHQYYTFFKEVLSR